MSLRGFKRTLVTSAAMLIGMVAVNAHAESFTLQNKALQPRADLTARTGNDNRRIGTVEGWAPLAQDTDRVLYADLRFTRENSDDDEGNIGLGYRTMMPEWDAMLGAHLWYDNRHTNRGTTVHQVTAGVEYFSDKAEFRANVYAPVNARTRTWITPNTGSATPYLAGNGIYVDTAGFVVEEPQPGFDFEGGVPFPPAEQYIDSLRMYGGYYSFYGDDTPDVHGPRVRLVADINPLLSIGARAQNDVRGRQVFLEATLRLPYAAKLMKRDQGLRSHLDESPVRDIDIVTGSVVDTGRAKPVLNTDTGRQQRVLYVDNTAGVSGDGSLEHPYGTLAAAQAALKDDDILYIAHGDGTAANQNHGIAISQNNVQVIGSGVDFVFDDNKFAAHVPDSSVYNGNVLKSSTSNPVIANIDSATAGPDSGNGVFVTGSNIFLTGFTVDGTNANGIFVKGDLGRDMGDVTISHVTTTHAAQNGIVATVVTGAHMGDISVDNSTSTNNTAHGIRVGTTDPDSDIGSVMLDHNTTSNNGQTGSYIRSLGDGGIGDVEIANATSSNNANGIIVDSTGGGYYGDILIHDTTLNANSSAGVGISLAGGTNADITIDTVTATATANGRGMYLFGSGGTVIDTITLVDNISSGNLGGTGRGIDVEMSGHAALGTLTVDHNTTNGNANNGQYLSASASTIQTVTVKNNVANTNSTGGIRVDSFNAGSNIASVTFDNNTTNTNTGTGLYLRTATAGTVTAASIKNNTSGGNLGSSGRGIVVEANGAGSTITSATLDRNTTSVNAQQGIYVIANAGEMDAVKLTRNTATGNVSNGVFIDDDTTATFVADMGGGALGSTGGNRIYSNTGTELRVDLDGGQLKAKGNWWGVNTGLAAGERTLDVGSTVDSTGFLTSDPGP